MNLRITLKEDKSILVKDFDRFKCVVYFGSPDYKLVTGGRSIRIWNTKNKEIVLQKKKDLPKDVKIRSILKWNKFSFICGGTKKILTSFSLEGEELFRFRASYDPDYLQKLTGDLFACIYDGKDEVGIISNSRKMEVKKIKVETFYGSKIRKSINFGSVFYINSDDNPASVQMRNCESGELLKKFKDHSDANYIYTLSIFLNQRKEEILFYCSNVGDYFFVNIGRKEKDINRSKYILRGIIGHIKSSCCIQNRYLVLALAQSRISVLDLRKFDSFLKKGALEYEGEYDFTGHISTNDFVFMEKTAAVSSDRFIMIDNNNTNLRVFNINGLDLKRKVDMNSLEIQDLVERKDYIFDESESLFLGSKKEFFTIKVSGNLALNIYKCFL